MLPQEISTSFGITSASFVSVFNNTPTPFCEGPSPGTLLIHEEKSSRNSQSSFVIHDLPQRNFALSNKYEKFRHSSFFPFPMTVASLLMICQAYLFPKRKSPLALLNFTKGLLNYFLQNLRY